MKTLKSRAVKRVKSAVKPVTPVREVRKAALRGPTKRK